jgi:predicted acyl esterase
MTAWLDNLIPLKPPRIEEHQLAGWQPTTVAMQGLGCRLLADQRVPVDSGVSLSADVYTPKRPGRYPAIVSFAAYSHELHTAGVPTGSNEIGSPPIFTDRGYAHVVLSRRGMGRSGGEAGIFLGPQDVDDHAHSIAWAAEQPWCDGNVVLFGTSYYAATQPLVAVRRPPALRAFFCNELTTDYFRHIWQFGGVFGLYFCNLWMGANFTPTMYRLRVPPVVRALLSHITHSRLQPVLERMVMKRVDAIYRRMMSNTPIKPAREWYANWMLDGKTRETNSMPKGPYDELDKIEIPFVVVQNLGYLNLHQFGCYDLFENVTTPLDRKWMVLSPPHYGLPVYDWQLEALAFFDHVLRKTDNGYAEQPPVRYWLDGENCYVGATGFPIPGSRPMRLYLASGGADTATHALTREAPAEGGRNSWAAVPLGLPVLGGFDEVANQTLTYELGVDEEVKLAGPVTAHLDFSCNEIDSHVVARLGRVATDGTWHLLSMGTISPARRRHDPERSTPCEIAIDTGHPEPLTPGEKVSLVFSLTPAPVRLRPGDRLRFDVASRTDLLKSDVSHGYVQFEMPVPPYFSRNTLHYGPECYVELWRVER